MTAKRKPGRPRLDAREPAVVLSIKVPPRDVKIWKLRAAIDGVSLGEWIRRKCNEGNQP